MYSNPPIISYIDEVELRLYAGRRRDVCGQTLERRESVFPTETYLTLIALMRVDIAFSVGVCADFAHTHRVRLRVFASVGVCVCGEVLCASCQWQT